MFVFLFLSESLFFISRVACEPAVCHKMRLLLCVSLLDSLLSIASLPDSNIFFSLFPFGFEIFSDFILDLSRSSRYFSSRLLFLGSMCSSRFLLRLVQRTACT